MDYQQKYLKYKKKYLDLKNNQKAGVTFKSGLYTYFTSEQILKDRGIKFTENADAPSIFLMNEKLNEVAYRVSEGSKVLELVIDNMTRSRLFGDKALETTQGLGNVINKAGTILAVSMDTLAVVASEGSASLATPALDSAVKTGASIAGKLTDESLQKLRDALKKTFTVPMVIELKSGFNNKSDESISETLKVLNQFTKGKDLKIDIALTLQVNKFTSNKFYSEKKI
jgi:hypothetical protein